MIKEFGFDHFGFTPLERPLSFDFYKAWLEQSYQGSMNYLANHEAIKAAPQAHWEQAHSAIVIARPYVPHPKPRKALQNARVALYARGEDYHAWFLHELQALTRRLQEIWPDAFFTEATDSKPLLERDLAYKAGLGWVGKNTCLIHEKKGSLFFIGEILTSLRLSAPQVLHPDRCGTCTRCLDVCPTQALIAPRTMDARKCISYLTIEAKADPAENLRSGIGDWLFGCDLCQTVCPWNEKVFGPQMEKTHPVTRGQLIQDLHWILTTSGKKIQKSLIGTPLLRAGPHKLKRTAIIVIANLGLIELQQVVADLGAKSNRFSNLAHWALQELKSRSPNVTGRGLDNKKPPELCSLPNPSLLL